eukprot:TRINITY_DN7363_c0_g1_i1.p1 TRINITY_DN7363_c0_g1~~TRINITY_DN7363_c0_g1_i1.p1  ORF type:complete len:549 (+),score=84.32 TRINITY_DN7363_c0_g1_i1:213-1859(+)
MTLRGLQQASYSHLPADWSRTTGQTGPGTWRLPRSSGWLRRTSRIGWSATVRLSVQFLEKVAEEDDFVEVRTKSGVGGWIRASYLKHSTLGERISRGVSFPEKPHRQLSWALSPRSSATSRQSTASSATVTFMRGAMSAADSEFEMYLPSCAGLTGLVVMLADSDAGSLIVCAQTGKVWGYSLVLINLMLVVPLYMAQELTVRVGVGLGMGYAEAVTVQFGRFWGAVVVCMLLIVCIGTLVTEMAAVAGVGAVMGLPAVVSVGGLVTFLSAIVATGSYRQVEAIALLFGVFEFTFFLTVFLAKPNLEEMEQGTVGMPVQMPGFQLLVAANIGAAMQPWMVFYQQSAVVDNNVSEADVPAARKHTCMGALVTQAVATSVMITAAGTLWSGGYDGSSKGFDTVSEISTTLTPHLGEIGGRVLFCFGFGGSAVIGAIVVSLTAAWGLGEVCGFDRSLERRPQDAPWFYASFAVCLFTAFVLTVTSNDLVFVNVVVQVMNATLLPVVLLLLFLMARRLPERLRLQGPAAAAYGVVFTVCSGLGVACTIASLR